VCTAVVLISITVNESNNFCPILTRWIPSKLLRHWKCLLGTVTSLFSYVLSPSDTIRVLPNTLARSGLTTRTFISSKFSNFHSHLQLWQDFLNQFPSPHSIPLTKRIHPSSAKAQYRYSNTIFYQSPLFQAGLWNVCDQILFSRETSSCWKLQSSYYGLKTYITWQLKALTTSLHGAAAAVQ